MMSNCIERTRVVVYRTLRRTFLGSCPLASFYYSGIEPLANQALYTSIIDPLLDNLTQDCVIKIIEESTDICINYPGDILLPAVSLKFFERTVLTMT